MKVFKYIALLAVAATVVALPTPAGAATVRQFEGTVTSVNRDARTFRLRDSERGTFTIKVTSRTRFERIAGFRGLKRGMTRVEATAVRSKGRWVARAVEISGGGGRLGGDDSLPSRNRRFSCCNTTSVTTPLALCAARRSRPAMGSSLAAC
jgi:hypothetical protein